MGEIRVKGWGEKGFSQLVILATRWVGLHSTGGVVAFIFLIRFQ